MDSIELNGHTIEVREIHEELPLVKFKLVRNWCKISDAFIPNKTAYQWLLGLGKEGFWDAAENKPASNSTLRRFIEQGAIRFNGKVVKPNDMLDFPILSVVLFPKSDKQYTTIF
jgi:hypothetical protein